jgi:hypothetical protein
MKLGGSLGNVLQKLKKLIVERYLVTLLISLNDLKMRTQGGGSEIQTQFKRNSNVFSAPPGV